MIDKVRELALKILYEVDEKDAYSNIVLDDMLKKARKSSGENAMVKIDQRDVGFISEIVYGTISWRFTIDEIIKKYSNIKLKKISPWILNILRLSIYQILFLDRVPKSAAVNEGVNLAKRYGHRASSNFVNAILRKVNKKDYEEFFMLPNDVDRIARTTSMPIWLVEKLLEQNDIQTVEEICQASNEKPSLSIRVNTLKTDKQTLINELEKEEVKVEEGELEDFLKISDIRSIDSLKSFQKGMFTVQDEAAGLIPIILNPKPNEKILDACSSPGGKTTYMAQIMENQGQITAWDLHEHRVKLVDKAADRLGIAIIKTEVKDATIYEEKYLNYFDKILLDVPCLGIGVLKRKPDIKWKRKQENIEEITRLQMQILQNCEKYLKKGGSLVYSTCSILKEENEEVISKFIENNKNFEIEKIKLEEKSFFKKYIKKEQFLQVYQNEKTDGFFICKLRKKEEKI